MWRCLWMVMWQCLWIATTWLVLVNCWCLAGMGDPPGLIYPPGYGSGKIPPPITVYGIPVVSYYCYGNRYISDGDLPIANVSGEVIGRTCGCRDGCWYRKGHSLKQCKTLVWTGQSHCHLLVRFGVSAAPRPRVTCDLRKRRNVPVTASRLTRRPRPHSYSRAAPPPSPHGHHLHRPIRPQGALRNVHASAAPNCRQPRPPPASPRGRRDGAGRVHVRRREAYLAATRLPAPPSPRAGSFAGRQWRRCLALLLLHLEIKRIGAVIRSIKACNLCKCSDASLSHGNHKKKPGQIATILPGDKHRGAA